MSDKATYGGQAVIEGVMMRGRQHFAVACRRASGEILVRNEAVPAFFTRYAWARWPFMRGVFALADSLVLGMKALFYSANLAMADQKAAEETGESEDGKEAGPNPGPLTQALLGPLIPLLATAPAGTASGGTIASVAITGSAVGGMAIGIGLFMLLPSAIAGFFRAPMGELAAKLIEGGVRVALVLGYIALVGRLKEVQRVFQYHGAEHQAINAWETEGRVDVDAAVRASRIHPRCGTNFVLTVLLVKALIFTVLPWTDAVVPRLALRLAMLPVVASISYEVIRLAGLFRSVRPLQWLVAPGLATQYLTTRVPDRGMVEVAVASLRGVMEAEGTLHPAEPLPEEAATESQEPEPEAALV